MSTALAAVPAAAAPQQAATSLAQPAGELRFDIPAGALDQALKAFEATTGLTLDVRLPADTLVMMHSPGVSGVLSASAALDQLLSGTALVAVPEPSGGIRVDLRGVRESVQVTGELPRVASPNYATDLTATPQTIQVIPQRVMEEQGTFTLSDALRNVPGITLQAGEGGGASSTAGDMFTMRGFSAANSLFVDNVRDDGLITRDVFNLEQVEVFLGPTGSDVGRGNAAGYVNMATKTPKPVASYGGILTAGSAETGRVTADINQPIALGEAGSWLAGTAIRLNALWQDSGVAGRDYVENNRRSVAPSIAFGLGTPTRVTVAGQFTRQENMPDYGVPGAAWSEPLTPTSTVASQPVDQSTYFGSPDYDRDDAEQDSVTARLEQDINQVWTLRNQTRFNETNRDAVITSIASPNSWNPATETVSFSRQVNSRRNRIVANQTNLSGRARTGAVEHALTFGLEAISEDYSAPGMTGAGTREPASIYDPNPFAPITDFDPRPSGATTDGSTRTLAVSGFDVMTIGARVQVNGGVRVENYDTDYDAITTDGVVTDLSASDTLVSGRAGLLYQITPLGNVYVSYGTAVTPPGTGNFALSSQPTNANNPNVDPQVSRNFEVGSKWELFERRLAATAALFDTRNTNVIYVIDATAVPPLFNQDDGQHVQGATLGLTGQLGPGWSVMANVAYMEGRLDSQNPANDGRRLTLLPEWSGSLWTTYGVRALTFGGGIRFSDRVFVNTANTITVPAYHLIDAVASYTINRHLTLRLNLYNLTDEVYIRNISNNGGRYNPGFARSALFNTQVAF